MEELNNRLRDTLFKILEECYPSYNNHYMTTRIEDSGVFIVITMKKSVSCSYDGTVAGTMYIGGHQDGNTE